MGRRAGLIPAAVAGAGPIETSQVISTEISRSALEARPIWRLRAPLDQQRVLAFSKEIGAHPIVAALLLNAGIEDEYEARRFLEPDLSALHDPFLMADMDRAVQRILGAIRGRETIAVYGDYDVDGVTSSALLVSFLRSCKASVIPYIPRRLVEGYGLNMGAVEELVGRGATLLIACDCGVTAVEEVERANSLGLDVVIIDHHRVPKRPPQAVAILNPHREDCPYPFGDLAAVGVTFKLLMALRRSLREDGFFSSKAMEEPNLRDLMDMVALGTVSDVVPLVDENRIFVSIGLRVLAEGRRVGLGALKAAAGVERGKVTAGQVAFRLGPRINAAGRLDDARAGLDLLLCEDSFRAATLAGALDQANSRRKAIEQSVLEQAMAQAKRTDPVERGLVLAGNEWHVGVVGIVASRVAERFRRPTLVLCWEGEVLRGSGRSVGQFHLHDALVACRDHLDRYGGHRAAAGLELQASRLESFREAFLDYCRDAVEDDDLLEALSIDVEMDPATVDFSTCEAVELLAPFGIGNPAPVFLARDVRLESCRIVGKPASDGRRHIKCRVEGVDAIGFGLVESEPNLDGAFDIAYTVGFNSYKGRRQPQIELKALLPAGAARIN